MTYLLAFTCKNEIVQVLWNLLAFWGILHLIYWIFALLQSSGETK